MVSSTSSSELMGQCGEIPYIMQSQYTEDDMKFIAVNVGMEGCLCTVWIFGLSLCL